jgi:histidine triad (HIT) family protein
MSTIFKDIIDKKINTDIIYEDDICIAFNDINPVAPVHILIIPKKEIATINDLNENDKEIVGHLTFVAKNIAKDKKIDNNGYRLVFNCNEDGGQSVYHIHLHLIGGRKFTWPPG